MTGYPPEKTRTKADELYARADSLEALKQEHRAQATEAITHILALASQLPKEDQGLLDDLLTMVARESYLAGQYDQGAERLRGLARVVA